MANRFNDQCHPDKKKKDSKRYLWGKSAQKKLILVLVVAFILTYANIYAMALENEEQVKILIIYDRNSSNFLDIYQNYKQSLLVNLIVEPISLDNLHTMDLSQWDMIYLDKSIIGKTKFNSYKSEIMDFVEKGGYLFLEDDFYKQFPLEFLGAKSFKEVEKFPETLDFPEIRENLSGLQNMLKLFHKDLVSFYDKNTLSSLDKGHGFIPSTATVLAYSGDLALYGINKVGEGYVFYANKILPNDYFITGFDMTKKDVKQEYFSFTFATANYLFRNEFAAFLSKDLYGYAAKKVLGPYGRPAMAWQNHFEVTSAAGNGTMKKWIDILKEYDEIPSFSLGRALYEWGLWKESIVLHTNMGSNIEPNFIGGEENSHYSSGKHLITEGNDYVSLKEYEEYRSLGGKIDLPYRAYPSVVDLNRDGIFDIVSGSQDGYIYFFQGTKEEGLYKNKVILKDEKGKDINVGKYSAPALIDINRNGTLDIIVGNENGEIYLYINQGNMTFKKNRVIIEDTNLKNAAPALGDLDGDNIIDLIVGNARGEIYYYKGQWVNKVLTFSKEGLALKDDKNNTIKVGTYAAPEFIKLNGKDILLVGNSTGYLRIYEVEFPNLIDKGYIKGNTLNLHGNKNLWGGYYSVPALADLNGDGNIDLLVGQIEFGLPTPIDSSLFPYEKELRDSIAYAKENYIDIYPHPYLGKYKTGLQEVEEMRLHKKAFEYYGLAWEGVGTNQHTWDISNLNSTQTFYSQKKMGIRWNSGFRPSAKAGEPSLSRDYIWTIPFRLGNGWGIEDFILYSPSPYVPTFEKAYESYTALDLPITHFYHIEYDLHKEDGLKKLLYKAEFLDKIRDEYDYNFMTEPQMFDIFDRVMDSSIRLKRNLDKNNFHLTISSTESIAGIKLEVGEGLINENLALDADIYLRQGKDIYVGLNREVNIYASEKKDEPHITRINVPVEIEREEEFTLIHLKDKGLQQIKIYAPRGLEVYSSDFKVESSGYYYTFTRYGEATTLKVKLY